MADRRLRDLSDSELGATLVGLSSAIAWPSVGAAGEPDLAAAVRVRIEAMPIPGPRGWSGVGSGLGSPRWWPSRARPLRRAAVLALVALLAVAAMAGAVGLGLPGLRLILGEATPTAPPTLAPATEAPGAPSPGPLGRALRLGEPLFQRLGQALGGAGFHVSATVNPAGPTPPE
jgi:hypothetical protein